MNLIGTTTDGDLIVTMTGIEYNNYPLPSTQQDEVILPYKHVSQRGAGAANNVNDCGPSCIVSCAHEHGYPELTVDDVAATYQRPNKPMHVHELRAGLAGYGLAHRYERPLTVAMIATHLREEQMPVIPLVSYRALPHRFDMNYRLSHYIVIYGVLGDGSFLYHDPLGDGRRLTITAAQLNTALRNIQSEGNLPNQGILLT